ncbi:ABC transporter ATP-binding protein [Kineosporia sp. NBRC 101677]|uniref:ABC transporter ATP-binding protein n=1 Tax=Kineosporia sp. NBRC 101677 TaxID=3032197 RepID=UPI00249FBBAF|nr:ABC transporter ATP-binding protein [Kineosporia sp. NBRC 101677]GLY17110.1 ABC transporter ATP-binding protein [Kineosporia sp. NBRC 101677]
MKASELLRPVRGALTAAVTLQALAGALVLVPLIVLIRFAQAALDEDPLPGGTLVATAVIATIGAALLSAAATVLTHRADADLTYQLREQMAETIRRAPLPTVTGAGAARIKKVVQDDTEALHYLVGHTLLDVTGFVVTPVVGLVALAVFDWRLALIGIVPLALGVTWYLKALNASGGGFAEFGRTQQEIGAAVVDYVQGLPSAKVYGGAGGARTRYLDATNAFHDFFRGWSRSTAAVTTASWLVVAPGLTAAGFALIGWAGMELGWVGPGGLVAGVLLGPAIGAPVAVVGPRLQAVRSGLAAASSIGEFLGQERLVWGSEQARGALRLEQVSHRYHGERVALENVSLDLPERGLIALVGTSGSGKSTIAALLARFTDPTEGRVLLGGVDLREVSEQHLYERIGFVFQDTALRRATVRDNLTGGGVIPDETVIEAARKALIHDEIKDLPNGYDTVLGADSELSGGQRQRVCLARAFLRAPDVLVLDEALSAVDARTRSGLVQTLRSEAQERAVLLIAHQMHLVREADLIVVLDQGRVAGLGAHDQLALTCPAYQALLTDDESGAHGAIPTGSHL